MNFGDEIEYRAFLRGNAATKTRPEERHIAAVELGWIRLPRPASLAQAQKEGHVQRAIDAMRQKCAEHAGLNVAAGSIVPGGSGATGTQDTP